MGPYAASKSAVHRLTESLADELKLKGVTVNAVLPSIIDTPANRADMPKADFAAGFRRPISPPSSCSSPPTRPGPSPARSFRLAAVTRERRRGGEAIWAIL